MVHDDSVESIPEEAATAEAPLAEVSRASAAGRMLLVGGVVGACALGAGLGLWARPSDIERPAAAKPPPSATLTSQQGPRRIPIVVDDTPAPIGKPLDVMSPSPARPAIAPQKHVAPAPEMMAPTRPPVGLLRVAAPVPSGPIAPTRPQTLLPPITLPGAGQAEAAHAAGEPAARKTAEKAAQQAAEAQAARKAAAERAAEQKLARQKLAEQKAAKVAAAREAAREHARELAEAKAQAKAERLAKLKAEREKAHAAALAKAEPPPRPKHGISALMAKLAPHHARSAIAERDEPKPAKARLARAAPRKAPKAEPPLMAPRGGGPIRVASTANTRCASADPGEALACGDPSLSAAERRLARAYRDAEDAGVPAATLAQQQQRWKQARAAAAREAPWAVREVYQARIAELQDLARDAKGN